MPSPQRDIKLGSSSSELRIGLLPRRASAWPLLVVAVVVASGCGPGGPDRRTIARQTVETTARALVDLDGTSSGSETEIAEPLSRARRWLSQAEDGLDVWSSSGSLAYETAAACLARSLGELRSALLTGGREVPTDLEEAEALAEDATDRPCAQAR